MDISDSTYWCILVDFSPKIFLLALPPGCNYICNPTFLYPLSKNFILSSCYIYYLPLLSSPPAIFTPVILSFCCIYLCYPLLLLYLPLLSSPPAIFSFPIVYFSLYIIASSMQTRLWYTLVNCAISYQKQ